MPVTGNGSDSQIGLWLAALLGVFSLAGGLAWRRAARSRV